MIMSDSRRQELAERGYRAYARYTGGKTFDGRAMPAWGDLPARIQEAWAEAAVAIAAAIVPDVHTGPAPSSSR